MDIINTLERIGYRFDLRITFDYTKPGQPPPEAATLLAELSTHKQEAVMHLVERSQKPHNIKTSEMFMTAINKSISKDEAFSHALACLSKMTGDSVTEAQAKERWLS